jgi:Tol biopolymer transport system component
MNPRRFSVITAVLWVTVGLSVCSCSNGDDDAADDDSGDDDDSFGLIVCTQLTDNPLELRLVSVSAPMAEPTTLAAVDGHSAIDPFVTPDGQTVLFSANFEKETPSGSDPPGGTLYRQDLATLSYERITDDDWMQVYERSPAVAADGTTIVYVRADRSVGPLESLDRLWTVQLDGSDKQPVFDNQEPRNDWAPAWSPDGAKLAYISDHGTANLGDIMVYDLSQGGDAVNLTNYSAGDVDALYMPFFDQAGQQVYYLTYTENADVVFGLYRVAVSGGEPTLVLDIAPVDMANHGVAGTAGYSDFRPTKDGSHFVLTGAVNDAFQVFTADALNSPFNPEAATDAAWDCLFPFWHRP